MNVLMAVLAFTSTLFGTFYIFSMNHQRLRCPPQLYYWAIYFIVVVWCCLIFAMSFFLFGSCASLIVSSAKSKNISNESMIDLGHAQGNKS
jgi:hypothetical protein